MILKKQRKRRKLGYFIVIDFSPEAKKYTLGNDFLKKIYHLYDGKVVKTENYNKIKIKSYLKNKIIVIDRTVGQEVSRESIGVPEVGEILSEIQLKKVIGD